MLAYAPGDGVLRGLVVAAGHVLVPPRHNEGAEMRVSWIVDNARPPAAQHVVLVDLIGRDVLEAFGGKRGCCFFLLAVGGGSLPTGITGTCTGIAGGGLRLLAAGASDHFVLDKAHETVGHQIKETVI